MRWLLVVSIRKGKNTCSSKHPHKFRIRKVSEFSSQIEGMKSTLKDQIFIIHLKASQYYSQTTRYRFSLSKDFWGHLKSEIGSQKLLVVTQDRVIAIILQFIEFMTWHQFNAVDTNFLQKNIAMSYSKLTVPLEHKVCISFINSPSDHIMTA